MNYWIFQGNPDVFDITSYVANNDHIVWSVRQKHIAKHMGPGDEVFLWRAAGKRNAIAGVVGIARITDEPRMMPDDLASSPLWQMGDPSQEELRVELLMDKKCTGDNEVVRRTWIKDDPELQGLRILLLRNQTNYRITAAEAKRLAMLCRSVGSSWSREEVVAALWAFKENDSNSVPNFRGSAVAMVATLTGRTVSDVQKRITFFRQLSHQSSGTDMSNTNQIERQVWNYFYDPGLGALDKETLDEEFHRLWGDNVASTVQSLNYIDFGEAPNDDPMELSTFAARVRKGQSVFRINLMELYENRCAISGWGPPQVLEAAHIYSHAEAGINHSSNGILIRADLHYLMDAGLLQIHPDTLQIHINESLRKTDYWELNGKKLRQRVNGSNPSVEYLRKRWINNNES